MTLKLTLFICLIAGSSFAQPVLTGEIIEVVDGRTVIINTITHNAKFRYKLIGIETPEENQELYEVVKARATQLLQGKTVKFRAVMAETTSVIVDGVDATAQLLRDGAGWLTVEEMANLTPESLAVYREVESLAKEESRGVWSLPDLVRPSEIRKLTVKSQSPLTDAEVANVAWRSLGPAVEGVFGSEIYSIENSSCSGVVTRVVDGDTVEIRSDVGREVTVRLAGIDAPELNQAGGLIAKQALSSRVLGRRVGCESTKKDRYGRTVGKLISNGSDVNLEMVRGCNAWHYKAYADEQSPSDRQAYSAADAGAKSSRCGIFSDQATAPWDYRASRFLNAYGKPPVQRSPWSGGFGGGGGYYYSSSGSSAGSGPVQVRGYYRGNGTYVQSHTRSRPK